MFCIMSDWFDVGGSIAAATIGGIFNNRAVKKQNEMNLQIARETNEAQLNAMRENNAFNKQAAIDMFNLESNYNSPYNQVQRLKEAGLNPAVLMEGNTSSTSGNTNASTPSAAATPSLYAPTMQAEPSVFSGLFQNMESITRMIDNVSKAKLSDAQKFDIMSKVQPMIDVMKSEEEKNRAQTAFQNVQTTLANISKHFAVRQKVLELSDMVASIALKTSQGELADAQKELAAFEAKLADSKNQLLIQQTPYLVNEVKEGVELLKQQQKTEQTKQAENLAGAEEKRENAETTRQTRESIVKRVGHLAKIAEHEETIKDVESRLSVETFQEQFESILVDLDISKAQKDLLREQYERARIDNDWAEVDHIMKTIGDVYGVARPAPTKPRAAGKRERSSYSNGTKYKWTEYLYE